MVKKSSALNMILNEDEEVLQQYLKLILPASAKSASAQEEVAKRSHKVLQQTAVSISKIRKFIKRVMTWKHRNADSEGYHVL